MDENTRLLFAGPVWKGSTARHRLEAFEQCEGVTVSVVDSHVRLGKATLMDRIRYRLRWPADHSAFNRRLLQSARASRPQLVMVDSVPVIRPATLRALRGLGVQGIAFYSPDDQSAPHIRTWQLARCEPLWDVMFTTKTYNVPEMKARGARRPLLTGNSYHPPIHRPWAAAEVGTEYERFDAVLAAAYEPDRMRLVEACVARGLTVLVLGGGWAGRQLPAGCEWRGNTWDEEYARAVHLGKVGLCPLRRVNRDRITQRSVELPGCRRIMLAEKTEEHDSHFHDGEEYVSYTYDGVDEAALRVSELVADPARRLRIAAAGRRRCETSGYSTYDRAREMWREMQAARRGIGGAEAG